MRKEIFDLLKKEIIYICLLFLLVLAVFKIAFYNESFFALFRNVLSLFWLFVLPGYFAMLYWHGNLEFFERFVLGIMLAAGITGITSYYLGLIGLNVKYHTILLPLLLMIAGYLFANSKKEPIRG